VTTLKCEDLRCPACGKEGVLGQEAGPGSPALVCGACAERFPLRAGHPVLIPADNELFDRSAYERPGAAGIYRRRLLRLPGASVNLSQRRVLAGMGRALAAAGARRILIVGAGRQRHDIERDLGLPADAGVEILCCDVDVTADVDVYCDAHRLPFRDGHFDAVITTAVLEHVLYPEQVAGEIGRVTRVGGLLYSELPFLQSVHEGAYDFTRYTLSGHRRLFNAFDAVESGMVAGPGTALVWSLEHFAASLFGRGMPSKAARAGARLLFFWLKYFDYLLARSPTAMDSASCTYFYGRRRAGKVRDADIVAAYNGGLDIRHV